SVGKGYPIGALLMLETGGSVHFKPRLLEGVPEKDVPPTDLLLDGQQRITSLYQTTFAQVPVRTRTDKGVEIERFYYLDIKKALAAKADLEEAIAGVPKDKIVRKNFGHDIVLDLSTREQEFESAMFPLNEVFDCHSWLYRWRDHWKAKGEDVGDLQSELYSQVIERIDRYKVPIIRLDKRNSREAICLVFEKVNVGGKKLDAFELVTAIYAADNYDLREDWDTRRKRIVGPHGRRDVLANLASTEFLQACSLMHTRDRRQMRMAEAPEGELPQISCKREAVLSLPLPAYRKFANTLDKGFIEAGAFLNEHKIIWNRDVPYPPMIVALATVIGTLGRGALTAAAKTKLTRWFWSVTFGELYGSATESRLARDVPELVDWLAGSPEPPRSLDEAFFQRDRLRTLRSRLSAAYKGLHALLMAEGCKDFISGKPTDIMTFFNDKIDIHHIFPQKWCKDKGIPVRTFNSIVNKTPLSKGSNIAIGGNAPSIYLRRIEQKHGISSEMLEEILRSHLIEPAHLRADDFDAFFEQRMVALSGLVGRAMGKSVVSEIGRDEPETDVESEES